MVDISKLPPVSEKHIRRVNFQVEIWKRAHFEKTDVAAPSDGHGWTFPDGKLEPFWYEGHVLPQQLVDIADRTMDNSDEDSNSEFSDLDDNDESDED